MNSKKRRILLRLIVALSLVVAVNSVFAATPFTPKGVGGYAPSSANNIPHYYYCHLGGDSEEITASITYGHENTPILVSATAAVYYSSIDFAYDIGDAQLAFSVAEVELELTDQEINSGKFIRFADAVYKVKTTQVAVLELP